MGDHSNNCSNVTVEQIIEHMTADLPTPDGQYIQLGFTPPSTPNENHPWPEYQQNHSQISRNVFLSSYAPSDSQTSFNTIEQNPNFIPQNSNYNYITHPNAMFLPDIQSNIIYDKQMNKSINPLDQSDLISVMGVRNGGYILYNPAENAQQFVQANQDITMCGYIYATDKHEFGLYPSNIQQSQLIKHENLNDQNSMYVTDPSVIQHQEMLLQQALNQKQQHIINSQQQQQSVQNRTPLIENLVGNWVPNTSGTYSPFGNSQSGAPNLYDNTKQDSRANLPIHSLHQPNLLQNNSVQKNSIDSNFADIDLTNFKNCNRNVKKRMVAEVKPMRPSYSDVLAKSAPQQNTSKTSKIEVKEVKNKSQNIKKNAKMDKNLKSTTNLLNGRQFIAGNEDIKEVNNEKNLSTSPHHKAKISHTENNFINENASEKWLTIENEENESNNHGFIFDQNNEFEDKIATKKTNSVKQNKIDDCNLSVTKNVNNSDNIKNNNGNKRANYVNSGVEPIWKETVSENYDLSNRTIDKNITKNSKKVKDTKTSVSYQTRPTERTNLNGGLNEKPCGAGKRQRSRKKDNQTMLGSFRRALRLHLYRWLKIALKIVIWFFHLLSDVFSLSVQLSKDLGTTLWNTLHFYFCYLCKATVITLMKIKCFAWIVNFIDNKIGHFRWAFWNYGKKDKNSRTRSNHSDGKSWLAAGLEHNITMPSTGEEAMKRLLACKGKDPYSILGVSPDCTDDDIKRYYKKQAFLVHPDKNAQPGAEEAFKILVHAFDIIGEPERRQSYDRKVAESHQVEQAWTELNDLLSQLHQKMEYAANTIRCTNCTKRHRRIQIDRPCYAARLCSQCKIHHAAREGDIWAESSCFGFLWHYYACMDGGVYDITEWAGCQRSNLRHLRPNTHLVQYRIVLGRQAGSNSSSHRHRHFTSRMHDGASDREPDLEEFLSNLYNQSGANTTGTTSTGVDGNGRPDSTRNRKKNKKKK